jgi:hypothetical protein
VDWVLRVTQQNNGLNAYVITTLFGVRLDAIYTKISWVYMDKVVPCVRAQTVNGSYMVEKKILPYMTKWACGISMQNGAVKWVDQPTTPWVTD